MIAVANFGRMNPVTIGHVKLANKMNMIAKDLGATPFIYLSHSYDGVDSKKFKSPEKCKNPLPWIDKVGYVRDAVHGIVVVPEERCTNIFEMMHLLYEKGASEVYVVVGDDRVEDFQSLNKYNGKGDPSDKFYFQFDKPIEFISAGARDDDSDDDSERASATLLRKTVIDDDFDTFKKFAGTTSMTDDMWETLRYNMGLEDL